jgi:hypothetical protein
MGFDIQTWLPLVTVTLAAAICLSVASFIMGSTKLPPCSGRNDRNGHVASLSRTFRRRKPQPQSPFRPPQLAELAETL